MTQVENPQAEQQPAARRFAHRVNVPVLTDTVEMIGVYRSLFAACRVNCDEMSDMFPPQTGFNHPVKEAQDKLLKDYAETMTLVSTAVAQYGSVKCVDCRVVSSSATFTFEYTE